MQEADGAVDFAGDFFNLKDAVLGLFPADERAKLKERSLEATHLAPLFGLKLEDEDVEQEQIVKQKRA